MIKSYFKSLRPINGFITVAGALIGNTISTNLNSVQMIGLCLGLFLIVGWGNVDNDLCDVETDRLNRPERPLVSGVISVHSMKIYAGLVLVLGILSMRLSSLTALLQALIAIPILYIYNRKLKRLPLVGNLVVALLCAWSVFTPHFPSIPILVWPAVLFAFSLTLVREMIKDVEDLNGDAKSGMKSTAVVLGADVTLMLARLFWAVILVMLPVPWQMGLYSELYLIMVLVLAGIPLFMGWRLRGKSKLELRQMSTFLKIGILGGLFSIIWPFINLF